MKNIIKGFVLIFAVAMSQQASAQALTTADSTGLAGDNFSLEGALELFKKAKSPEAFETALNTESNSVNNLDLNEDGKTDYVKVKDIGEKNAHVLVMQVDVNGQEMQDIAVITIEKTDETTAAIQIKGADELYGEDKLIEPVEEKIKGGKGGPDAVMETYFVWVNVWYWPCVQYIYAPTYVYWYSPWYWDYYPTWWSPYYVRPWRVYYHSCYHYRPYCHQVYEYRNYDAYALYGSRKSTSATVHNRYERSTYKTKQDSRTDKQTVTGSERVKQSVREPENRTSKEQKTVQPTREKTNVSPAPSQDKRTTVPQNKPTDVSKERNTPSRERVNTAPSTPSKSNESKERVSPSKTPSMGRSNSQPSQGGRVSPQRSAPSPQRSAPAPAQRSSGTRRK